MNYQLNAIKMKSNRSLACRIAAGSADAGDITVAYRTLSYLFDAFLVSSIYDILYHVIDRLLDGYFTRNWDYYAKDPFGELMSTISGAFFEVLYSSLECVVEQPSSSKARSV